MRRSEAIGSLSRAAAAMRLTTREECQDDPGKIYAYNVAYRNIQVIKKRIEQMTEKQFGEVFTLSEPEKKGNQQLF